MPYATTPSDGSGVQWWFGFEAGGPSAATPRPLDQTHGPLAEYLGDNIAEALACPEFPKRDPNFVAKFDRSSAHFGYNGGLCWPFPLDQKARRLSEVANPSGVFAFADAVHQDFSPTAFYEPHTVSYRRVGLVTGAGHFRHHGRANLSYLDGHAATLEVPTNETVWLTIAGSDVANVDIDDGPNTRYGFATWTR